MPPKLPNYIWVVTKYGKKVPAFARSFAPHCILSERRIARAWFFSILYHFRYFPYCKYTISVTFKYSKINLLESKVGSFLYYEIWTVYMPSWFWDVSMKAKEEIWKKRLITLHCNLNYVPTLKIRISVPTRLLFRKSFQPLRFYKGPTLIKFSIFLEETRKLVLC